MISLYDKHKTTWAVPLVRLSVIVALVASSLFTVWERSVFAQDQAVIDKVVQLNKKAMDDFDTADFDTAKKSLLDAEKIGKRAGLESHPVMARTYIHLGALYLTGYKDSKKAQHYFGKAIDIQPDIKLDRSLTSPSVRDLFATVQSQKAGSADEEAAPPPPVPPRRGRARPDVAPEDLEATPPPTARRRREAPQEEAAPAASGDVEPDLPATVTALDCPYPDDAPPGKKVTLRCVAADSLGVAKVALFYKAYQMSDYENVIMTKSEKGWWQATIPKKRVNGTSIQFYFEGINASNKPVVSNGRAESPNVMLIVERGNTAKPRTSEEEENPLEEKFGSGPKLLLGNYDKSRIGVDARYGNRRFWIGLGVGSGFVYAINGVPEARVNGTDKNFPVPGPNPQFDMNSNIQVTGFGWAGLGQLAPEIGFQFNPDWAISIEGRNQWIPQATKVAAYTASGAHAVLLKVIRYTKQQRFRMFFAAAGGGGEGIRMNIQDDFPTNPQLKDTVLIGPVLLGGSVGMLYEISKRFSWIMELNALFGVPKAGLALDLNTAIQMNLGDTSGAAEEAKKKKKVDSVSGSIDDEEPQ
jgi:hypothetical protein